MKIGIDGTPLAISFPCGVKHYAKQLIYNLARIDKKNEYIIFAKKNVEIPIQENFRLFRIPSFIPILKRQFFLTYFAKKEGVDVFHYPEPYGAIFYGHPKIITTVHDLNLKFTYPLLSKYFLNRILCEATRFGVFQKTKVFITGTKTIKKELKGHLSKFNVDAPIYVTPYGFDKQFKVLPNCSRKQKFFLCMGDFAPRKNISRILQAYSRLPIKIKNIFRLKIVASTDQAAQVFSEKTKDLFISPHVDILVNVSLKKLILLYNQATVFVFPSLYEGFGIPIIEAMTCGCPVITSNYGSMKELAQKAAFLVNPYSEKEILSAMKKIVQNKKFKAQIRAKGLKRARQFSWEKTAKETLKLYKKVNILQK